MRFLLFLLCFAILIACKPQEYQLEVKPKLILKEGFYIEIPPAISEGKSYVKVILKFEEFDKETLKIKGFYFRNNFISMKEVKDPFSIEGSIIRSQSENISKNIPFELEPFEVVLSYENNKKLKYIKYSVKRKISFDDVPR